MRVDASILIPYAGAQGEIMITVIAVLLFAAVLVNPASLLPIAGGTLAWAAIGVYRDRRK